MKSERSNADGLASLPAITLIIILMIGLAAVVYVMVTGTLVFVPKSAQVPATVGVQMIPLIKDDRLPVISLVPKLGEPFYIIGQQRHSGINNPMEFMLIAPDSQNIKPVVSDISTNGVPTGGTIYFYHDNTGYKITDSMTDYNKKKNLRPLDIGEWAVHMIDNNSRQVIGIYKVPVGRIQTTINPISPRAIWTLSGPGWNITNASGIQIPYTSYGTVPTTGPNNMPALQFNGTGSYVTFQNNPDLTYTGELSVSLWMNSTNLNSAHQLIGKGVSDLNDNYDLFTLNNQLYFEWADSATGQMYHIMTNTSPLQTSQWDYVTLVIDNRVPKFYNNGAEIPISYYAGNNPWINPPTIPPVQVNLTSNNEPVQIGEQNYPGAPFYYGGSMGPVALYNRALTVQEILYNNSTYQA